MKMVSGMFAFAQFVTVACALLAAARPTWVFNFRSMNVTNTTSSGTSGFGSIGSRPTADPDKFKVDAAFEPVAAVTIVMVNDMPTPVSIMYASNPGPSLVGNPQAGTLAPAGATQVVMPQGWAGRATVEIDGNDPQGTKWEASLSSTSGFQPFIDVSYVDGYSVPMTCSCNGSPIAGCNIELWATGIQCPSVGVGPVCYNPAATAVNGPAQAFFAPCQGAAYTFPNDNRATAGCAGGTELVCCIGSGCPAPSRQLPPPAGYPV